MKKTIKSVIILAVTVFTATTSMAQKGVLVNLNYNFSIPLGSGFRDYVDNNSFGSFQGSVLYGISERFRAGVQLSYTDFHHDVVRGHSKNTVRTTPLWAKAEYTFIPKGMVRPYLGMGAGVNFINYRKTVNNVEDHIKTTKSALTWDAGVYIPIIKSERIGARVSTSYNALHFKREKIKNLDNWNIAAGVTVRL
jgi:opacity protein-like surface antigen